MNYERDIILDDIALDPSQLTEEWLRHPALFIQYALEETETEKKMKIAAEKVKVVRSELIKEAAKLEGKKLTVAEMEAFYRTAPRYREAKDKLIEAEYELSMIHNAVTAFYRREKSLANLVHLLQMEYWAKPDRPIDVPGGKRLADHQAERKTATARQKLNQQRRK